MSFNKYLDIVSGNFRKAIKVEWLNYDESVSFEFTNALYDINVDLSVNHQDGSRRTCTLTLNNDRNKFPVNFNNIWLGQKFKLWMGVYLDEKTPYYLPQGVFYISNPNDVYQPSTRTIKINGVDKWAFLDGTLHGKLSGTYQTGINTNLYDATRELLKLPSIMPTKHLYKKEDIEEYFEIVNGDNYYFEYKDGAFESNNRKISTTAKTRFIAKRDMIVSFDYKFIITLDEEIIIKVAGKTIENTKLDRGTYAGERKHTSFISSGQSIYLELSQGYTSSQNAYCKVFNICVDPSCRVLDPIQPFISPVFLTKKTSVDGDEVDVWKCPYTAKVERGKTYADVLLEYATILCARIYYDVNGRLVIEPMIDTADDITDTNKEIVWHYTVDEKTLLGLSQTYNFDKVYNDIIVLGNIVNGYQFKARVQNKNIMSDTCIQKIGLKTKEPFEDNQYYSDEQCKELAMYYAKTDTILQKSGDIESTPLYHLDVNKLVSISTPNNNMSKELFLITGFTINSSNTMTVNITSVNILKDFSVVEVDINE